LLRTLTAFIALVAVAAFGQDRCGTGYLCFERGEAKLASPADVSRFVTTHREKLGLTGKETFRCSVHGYLDGRPPNYAYVCQQPFVQGVATRYLSMRMEFRSSDGDVAAVRCRCVREDVRLPQPTIGRKQAEERGLRFFYARFPEVPQASIAVIDSQEPVVQWDFRRNGFRLARNVRYHYPLPLPQMFTTRTHGEVTVSIDALDESVLRAVGAELYIRGPGIPQTRLDELNATLAAMPFGEEQFDVAQKFYAFGGRGEAEVAQIEQRLKSRARWEPDSVGKFHALFIHPTSSGQLAAFLKDYDLRMLHAGFQYMYGGQLRSDSISAQARDGDGPAIVMRDAFERARAQAEVSMSSFRSASAQNSGQVVAPTEPAELRFNYVEFEMRHADALRLYEKERGKRLLTLSPFDQLDIDVGLDSF